MNAIEIHLIRWSMLIGPAFLFLGNALHPVNHNRDEQAWLAGIADHRTQWYVAHLLVFAALPLFVLVVVGLLRRLRDRRAPASDLAAFVALLGIFGAGGFVAVEGLATWQMTVPEAGRSEMVGLLERFDESAGTFLPTGLATLLFAVALGALGWTLVRAKVSPSWAPWLLVFSRVVVVTAFVAGYAGGEYPMPIIALADLLLLVAVARLRPAD